MQADVSGAGALRPVPLLFERECRAVGRAVYERVSAVGIAFVLLLFFIGLSNDINRLGGG